MAFNVHEIVTNRIIEELEKGIIPWHKPWIRPQFKSTIVKAPCDRNSVAYNGTTGHIYSVLNQMLVGKAGAYATFKQIVAMGGKVNSGEKSSTVVFWEMHKKTETDENGNEVERTFGILKYFPVFHIESQTTGIDPAKIKDPVEEITEVDTTKLVGNEWSADEKAEAVAESYIAKYGIGFANKGIDRAYYQPSLDAVVLPLKQQFENSAEYYGTMFHELAHSTGHSTRLDRFEHAVAFGDAKYAKEELVAEISSACICNLLGLDTSKSFTNSVAYIQSWLKALKNDTKLIVSASSQSEKAVSMIMG